MMEDLIRHISARHLPAFPASICGNCGLQNQGTHRDITRQNQKSAGTSITGTNQQSGASVITKDQ